MWDSEVHGHIGTKGANILHEELRMRKLWARWVPHLLKSDQKQMHKQHSQQHFDWFKCDPTNFVWRFVTMDEIWIHHYTLENQICQSSGWKPVVQRQRKLGRLHLPERSWPVLGCQIDLLTSWMWKFMRRGLAWRRKNHLSPGQCICSQKCVGNDKTMGFWGMICLAIPLFSWFGTLRLPSLPKPEEICFWNVLRIQSISWE